jgi:hypothetical protein
MFPRKGTAKCPNDLQKEKEEGIMATSPKSSPIVGKKTLAHKGRLSSIPSGAELPTVSNFDYAKFDKDVDSWMNRNGPNVSASAVTSKNTPSRFVDLEIQDEEGDVIHIVINRADVYEWSNYLERAEKVADWVVRPIGGVL